VILYTPLHLEIVLEGLEKMKKPKTRVVEIGGVPLILEDIRPGEGKVVRLLSTNPKDYLRSDFYPGAIIKYEQFVK
jgi:hypothetical protein